MQDGVEHVWANGNDHLVSSGRVGVKRWSGAAGRGCREHAALRIGPGSEFGAAGCGGRIIYRRRRTGAWLSWTSGANGSAVRAESVFEGVRGADLSDGRPGATSFRRADAVSGAAGSSGQDSWFPD